MPSLRAIASRRATAATTSRRVAAATIRPRPNFWSRSKKIVTGMVCSLMIRLYFPSRGILKRAFDIMASVAGLILLAWLILLLAVAIRLSSPGPGLLAQERVGRHKRTFTCYKLRTMYINTPNVATHETQVSSVTPLGRWLRRMKLDELPQLWNVLNGDMSFVGPRPCLPTQSELIKARQERGVFVIRPGITGKAQVLGVDMGQPERLAEIDAAYIAEQSFLGDLMLIAQTLTGRGRGDRIRDC